MTKIAALIFFALASTGCSLGQGEGRVYSSRLVAHECWEPGEADSGEGSAYDMQPDFFAANPFRETLQIRVQRGTDLVELSDGLAVLIDDVPEIRDNRLGAPQRVAMPLGVTPPGSPTVPPPDLIDDPPLVHMALYLQHSCRTQNVVLYAVDGTITFERLYSGDPTEKSAEDKLTKATFRVQMGDLRDVPLGQYPRDIPADKQSTVEGYFNFYYERGQPGQPFP